jgi:type VI secretion system secreted protein VgrG
MRFRARLIQGSLPADAVVAGATVDEGLSRLFRGEVVVATDDPDVDLASLIWSELALEVYDDLAPGVPPRPFHGMVTSAAYLDSDGGHHRYQLVFEPSIRALAYRVRSRIFQDLDAPGVVRAVLAGAGLDPDGFVWTLGEDHATRGYCVQYRESELDFVLRLLEDEGIFFWFEHDAAGHTMHLADAPGGAEPIDGDPTLPFSPWPHETRDVVHGVVLRTQVTHDAQMVRDWDWENPGAPVDGRAAGDPGALERYEYPSLHGDAAAAARVAARRLDEARQDRYRLTGRSSCLRLAPGRTFSLVEARPETLLGDWLLLGLRHRFTRRDPGTQGPRFGYEVELEGQLADMPFRPRRTTPRPRVEGIESAVVTGPAGEEIHTDAMGRVKVHFYWDREGAVDDTSSCWLRVQQNNTSGALMLPRIGWEVSVAFVDGDPDRPLVLQKLYNLETMPPYPLPDNQSQSALQSSTSPGGGSVNELRLQDSGGGQQLAVYASRDYSMIAGNDLAETIGANAAESVAVSSSLAVGASQGVSIGGDQRLSVSGSSVKETEGALTVDVGANDTWGVTALHSFKGGAARSHSVAAMQVALCNHYSETVKGSSTRTIGAAHAIAAAGSFAETVGGAKHETVGGAKLELIAGAKQEQIGAAKSLTSGAVVLKAGADVGFSAGGALAITAAGPISIKAGEGFTVTGTQVRVAAPGGAKLKGGSGKLDLVGGTITIDASKFGSGGGPMLQLKGRVNFKP